MGWESAAGRKRKGSVPPPRGLTRESPTTWMGEPGERSRRMSERSLLTMMMPAPESRREGDGGAGVGTVAEAEEGVGIVRADDVAVDEGAVVDGGAMYAVLRRMVPSGQRI